jgi:hypothetical protein
VFLSLSLSFALSVFDVLWFELRIYIYIYISDLIFKIYFFFLFFIVMLGWGYIVAFTKVLTIYKIYHNLNSPPHPLSPFLRAYTLSHSLFL